jgi:nitrogenase molybdenum-iron protein alpha/beta subunit
MPQLLGTFHFEAIKTFGIYIGHQMFERGHQVLKAKIAEVFEEPGCDKNQGKSEKERKKGCTKQLSPGAAAGGCAFDGAKIALQPIADVAHLVHGPIACEGNSWDNRHSASSGPQIYRTGFTTDINELDVIYGGEKRLFKSIREISKNTTRRRVCLPDLRDRADR